jgi:hypothetical protein
MRRPFPNRPLRPVAADTMAHFLVRLFHLAEISAESILVHLLEGLLIPEAAPIRCNLIAEQDLPVMAPKLELEVYQDQITLIQELPEVVVDQDGPFSEGCYLLRGSKVQKPNVIVVDQGVVEGVILVKELKDRLRERHTLLEAQALGQTPGTHIPYHDFDLDELESLDQHLPVG